jgi:hypothetical protein
LSLSDQAGMHTDEYTHKELFYGAATDRLPPTTGNPGAVATTLSGRSGIAPRAVCRQAGITQMQVRLLQLLHSELLLVSVQTQEPQQTLPE